jgi:hypothetical protein
LLYPGYDQFDPDRALQEAIHVAHRMLTGYVIETVPEPGTFGIRRYLLRLRRILSSLLMEWKDE